MVSVLCNAMPKTSREFIENSVNKIFDSHAHELAEMAREYVDTREGLDDAETWLAHEAINLIDPHKEDK